MVANCCTAIRRLPGQPSLLAVLTGAFCSVGLHRIKKCVRSGKVVRSWSAVILAPVSQYGCAHVCLLVCGCSIVSCHLCVLVCLLCWHTTASVPDVAQDAYRAMEFQTLYTIVKQELATSPTDP